MKKPWYQIVLTSYLPWIATAFLFIGSILDTISNTIALITPIATYIGTVSIILFLLVTEFSLRRSPVAWLAEDGQIVRFKSLWPWLHILSFGVILSLWLPRVFHLPAQQPQLTQTKLTVSCDIQKDLPVEFKEYSIDKFRVGEEYENGFIIIEKPKESSWTNYHPIPAEYLGLASFFVECRITNLSNKNVSLEYVRSYLEYKVSREHNGNSEFENRTLSYDAAFQGTFKNQNEQLELPVLLQQGEQIVMLVKTGWLIHERSFPAVNEAFNQSPPPANLRELYERLSENGTGLNENGSIVIRKEDGNTFGPLPIPEWDDPRELGIAVKAADGTMFHVTLFVF